MQPPLLLRLPTHVQGPPSHAGCPGILGFGVSEGAQRDWGAASRREAGTELCCLQGGVWGRERLAGGCVEAGRAPGLCAEGGLPQCPGPVLTGQFPHPPYYCPRGSQAVSIPSGNLPL